jgi:hypothetical protein
MAGISDEAIEKRAKALAEQEGEVWDIELGIPNRYGKPTTQPLPMGNDRRKQYRERARAELQKEADNA